MRPALACRAPCRAAPTLHSHSRGLVEGSGGSPGLLDLAKHRLHPGACVIDSGFATLPVEAVSASPWFAARFASPRCPSLKRSRALPTYWHPPDRNPREFPLSVTTRLGGACRAICAVCTGALSRHAPSPHFSRGRAESRYNSERSHDLGRAKAGSRNQGLSWLLPREASLVERAGLDPAGSSPSNGRRDRPRGAIRTVRPREKFGLAKEFDRSRELRVAPVDEEVLGSRQNLVIDLDPAAVV